MEIQTTNNKTNLTVFTPELNRLLAVISEPAREIVQKRYSGLMFREMGQANRMTSAEFLLADLAVFTGIKIPSGDALKRLVELTAESLEKDYGFFSVPLMEMGLKKYCSVLTTGGNKSYGRILSLADLHQVMDSFLFEVQDADKEVSKIQTETEKQKVFTEDEKQNKIRETVEETYQSGDFDRCTYADFNQLLRDGILTENSLKKNAWIALSNLKKKYINLSAKVLTGDDPQSTKGLMEKLKYKEKLDLLTELENDIKAETAKLYMIWIKERNYPGIYIKEQIL